MARPKKQIGLCFKIVVKREDDYESAILSNRMLKYRIGKKTESAIGPIFAFKEINFGVKRLFLNLCEIFGAKKIAVFECEYVAYSKPVKYIIADHYVGLLPRAEFVLFWSREEDEPKLYAEDPASIIKANAPNEVFATWIKPLREVDYDNLL
jgi:hypothetical protein